MKIGIIGTGNMGRWLGKLWAEAGHEVLFGSRDPSKAQQAAASSGPNARAGDFDAAAAFGDAVLYTVRDVPPSRLLRHPGALAGKVLIDCNNSDIVGLDVSDPTRERRKLRFPVPIPSIAERLAVDAPSARVVKAFNTIPMPMFQLEREQRAAARISVFLCSDDASAKEMVRPLVEGLGFVAVDCGELERAQLLESAADFLRFQILGMGLPPTTALSLHSVR